MSKNILVIHGPNLNMLGQREPKNYGSTTLKQIEEKCMQIAHEKGATIDFFQSNHEGNIVDKIQEISLNKSISDIIINAAGLSHTSIAIMDSLLIAKDKGINIIEVHLSNIHQREGFRKNSYISLVANGVICGFKELSYYLAIESCCYS